MAISYVNSAAATATSLTYPTGIQAGDLILYYGFRTATTAPSLPSGYTAVKTNSGDASSYRVASLTAAGTESGTTSPTYTNATQVMVLVYRGVTAVGGTADHDATTSPGSVPTISFLATNANSWVVGIGGSKQGTSQAVANMTKRIELKNSTTSMIDGWDTNGGQGTFPAQPLTLGSSTDSWAVTLELEGASNSANGITVVQATTAYSFSVASLAATFPAAVTAGNSILCLVWAGTNASDVSSVSDNKSNPTYTQIYQVDDTASNGTDFEVWMGTATTGGSSFIVTAADTGFNIWWMVCYEVSGLVSSSWLDQSTHTFQDATGGAVSTTFGSNTTQTPELLMQVNFAAGLTNANQFNLTSGWSNLMPTYDYTDVSAKGFAFTTQLQIVNSTGTFATTVGWVGSTQSEFDAIMVSLKAAGGSSGGPVAKLLNVRQAVNRAGTY